MIKTKYIVVAALMAAIAAIFQCLPVLFSEIVIFMTILSALPIYTASRMKPVSGILAYLVAAFLIFLLSTHEGLFFLCTNGIIGLSLGICRFYKQKKLIILLISSFSLLISLSIMNYIVGIPIFGVAIPGKFVIQLLLIALFSAVYNFFYLLVADFLYNRLITAGITLHGS